MTRPADPSPIAVALLVSLATAFPACAQAPGVPIERGVPLTRDAKILKGAKALREGGKLLKRNEVTALLKAPRPERIDLPACSDRSLSPREIYRLARAAYVRLGWNYRCKRCDDWHLNLAGGYAIAAGGVVATCYHVVEPNDTMREGYLIAVTADGAVRPVSSVLAAHERMDAAIVRVDGADLAPLPLNDNAAPGDAAYLFSDPLKVRGYFSTGMVNRFYWSCSHDGDPATLDGAARLRLNVSTDWAPGSSGAAVLDACGNAIGHVTRIAPMGKSGTKSGEEKKDVGEGKSARKPSSSGPLITLHVAVPARGVRLLARALGTPASPSKADASRKAGD
jgi:hypothetical protein